MLHGQSLAVGIDLRAILQQTKSGEIIFHDLHIPDVVAAIDYFKQECNRFGLKLNQFGQGHYKLAL
jgi:hypothetical protein